MGLTFAALAAGLVIGVATGGRLSNLGRRAVRAWPLLAAGLAVGLLGGQLPGLAAVVCTLCAYALLIAFGLRNLVLTGMGLVLIGLSLNALVMAVDGGMPVQGPALVAAGLATPAQLASLSGPHPSLRPVAGRHHLAGPSDSLRALGDTVPLAPFGEVASFGDLILAVGLADVMFRLTRPRRPPAHSRRSLHRALERHPARVSVPVPDRVLAVLAAPDRQGGPDGAGGRPRAGPGAEAEGRPSPR